MKCNVLGDSTIIVALRLKSTLAYLSAFITLLFITACAIYKDQDIHSSRTLFDASRNRQIPVEIYFPKSRTRCSEENLCPVAFISPGFGIPYTHYSFIAEPLAASGYLVVAIQSVLPNEPMPNSTGNIFADRMPIWRRGVDNLRFVKYSLAKELPTYTWSELVLIGHSNGGDFSALALTEMPDFANTLITLDHRRYPLPRLPSLKVLSIRGSDFPADDGVLPSIEQTKDLNYCITKISKSQHNDMQDDGPEWLKSMIIHSIVAFLTDIDCPSN
jgi:hypothetical protein